MSYFEMIIILAGAAIALSPIGIILGANLLEQWRKENEEKAKEGKCK
jgi:hypothetical protein